MYGPYIVLCLSERDFRTALRELNVPKDRSPAWVDACASAACHTFTREGAMPTCVVCLRDAFGEDPIVVAGLLVHEAVHVWQTAREALTPTSAPGIELEAYAIQNISQELMRAFRDQLKKGKA